MKWHKKSRKKRPDDKEERVIKKFLFYPKCIDDEWRWLEKVKIRQRYMGVEIIGSYPDCNIIGGYWINCKWEDT